MDNTVVEEVNEVDDINQEIKDDFDNNESESVDINPGGVELPDRSVIEAGVYKAVLESLNVRNSKKGPYKTLVFNYRIIEGKPAGRVLIKYQSTSLKGIPYLLETIKDLKVDIDISKSFKIVDQDYRFINKKVLVRVYNSYENGENRYGIARVKADSE